MLAVDGDCIEHVSGQLRKLSPHATHLFVSVGGNDALGYAYKLNNDYGDSRQLFSEWAHIQAGFRKAYRKMLHDVLKHKLPTAICTIYDAVPGLGEIERAALSLFNDVIVGEASANNIPFIDLRAICTDPRDYSAVSPIEPSSQGGEKISAALARVFMAHDFATDRTVVYT